jgi:hypothetical protein
LYVGDDGGGVPPHDGGNGGVPFPQFTNGSSSSLKINHSVSSDED